MKNHGMEIYLDSIKEYDILSTDAQRELLKKAQNNDEEARNKLVHSNLRFVISIAKKYSHSNISLDELIAEGNIGLIAAIEKFDLDQKNISFISYASWWIRHFIMRLIQQSSSLVRLPINKLRLLQQIQKTQELVSEDSDVSYTDTLEQAAEINNISLQEVRKLINSSKRIFSLDNELDNNSDKMSSFLDSIIDENAVDINVEIQHIDALELINILIAKIPPREADIIIQRYGLHNNVPKPLSTLSKEYGLTKERVRQLELKGIQRMQRLRKQLEKQYMERETVA